MLHVFADISCRPWALGQVMGYAILCARSQLAQPATVGLLAHCGIHVCLHPQRGRSLHDSKEVHSYLLAGSVGQWAPLEEDVVSGPLPEIRFIVIQAFQHSAQAETNAAAQPFNCSASDAGVWANACWPLV